MSSNNTPPSTFSKFFEHFRRPLNQRSMSSPAALAEPPKQSMERRKTVDGGIQPLRGEDRKEDRYLSGVLAAGSGL
jgi:hypothetical protein